MSPGGARVREGAALRPHEVLGALALCAFSAVASAQAAAGASALQSPADVGASHVESVHTATIRSAHLARLHARITVAPLELIVRCRYESEISSLPPAGAVALTFDDGPEPGLSEHILDVLERHRVPATFFVIGEKAERHPELLARMHALPGARIGNHSWSHPNFHDIDAQAQRSEIDRNDALLQPIIDAPAARPKLFRYPYGNSSCEGNEHVHALGYRIVGWHVDSCDWAFDHDGSVDAHEALSCGVLAPFRRDFQGHVLAAVRAHRGGIVLLHEIHRNTVLQLEDLILRLKAEGYRFTTLDEPDFAADLR
jgi:peptidoglycan-N-acetylglucosamine deacetylase